MALHLTGAVWAPKSVFVTKRKVPSLLPPLHSTLFGVFLLLFYTLLFLVRVRQTNRKTAPHRTGHGPAQKNNACHGGREGGRGNHITSWQERGRKRVGKEPNGWWSVVGRGSKESMPPPDAQRNEIGETQTLKLPSSATLSRRQRKLPRIGSIWVARSGEKQSGLIPGFSPLPCSGLWSQDVASGYTKKYEKGGPLKALGKEGEEAGKT